MINHIIWVEKPRVVYPLSHHQSSAPLFKTQQDLDSFWALNPILIPTFVKFTNSPEVFSTNQLMYVSCVVEKITDFEKLTFDFYGKPKTVKTIGLNPYHTPERWESLFELKPLTEAELTRTVYGNDAVSDKIKQFLTQEQQEYWNSIRAARLRTD